MKTIVDPEQGWKYVARLGFTVRPGFPGWIVEAQRMMTTVERQLWIAAGKKYPYQVRYNRAMMRFTVRRNDGSEYWVKL